MRTVYAILCFLFFSVSSLSQTITIIDTSGLPVPYATVELPRTRLALFADLNGTIDALSIDAEPLDTLIFSSIGFVTRKVAAHKLTDKVVLERQVKEMEDVFVYGGKWKKENWGSSKNPGVFGFPCSWNLQGPGSQIGRVIYQAQGKNKPAWIYKVAFYVERAQNKRTPVRLRMYNIDEKGLPEKDLWVQSTVEVLDKGSGWIEFDLTGNEMRIPKSGLIIAGEYFDTDTSNWNTEKRHYIDSSGRKIEFVMKRYGGSFGTNDETNQGPTVQRFSGYWFVHNRKGINPACENLVVRVWVKYPK